MTIRKFTSVVAAATLIIVAFGLRAESASTKIRWDIVSLTFDLASNSATAKSGGIAAARANDDSRLAMTGFGTFTVGSPGKVTGGGTWTIGGTNGKYRVTRLVNWMMAPGTPPSIKDEIGNLKDARAGLAELEVRFSDGSRGVLTVSCHLSGTPDSVFEGIIASKGFITYWNREAPDPHPALRDQNRTIFHVVK